MMITYRKYIKHIPNALSISRLVFLPFLGYLAYVGLSTKFGVLLIVYALTDTLDGNIARKFNITSEFGAKLDSFADDLGNLFMIPFVYLLFPEIFSDYAPFVWSIVFMFVLSTGLRVAKLRNIGLHFYTGKLSQAVFLVMVTYMSIFSFNRFFFFSWFAVSIVHFTEIITALLFFKPNSNTRSIFDLFESSAGSKK